MATDRIPDWLLERLASGDLAEAEAEALRRRLTAEPDGTARLEAIRASNEKILAAHPPARVTAAIRQRADGARPARRFLPLALAAPAMALVAVVAVQQIGVDAPRGLEGPEEIRLKGAEPKLVVHRARFDGPEKLAEGSEARARDLLQLSYQAAGASYGVVLSVDGNGNVILHLPDGGFTAAPLEAGGAVPLPQAYELDDAPDYERFFLVTGASPFPVETALDAARRLLRDGDPDSEQLPLPASLHQTSFLLKKVQ